MRFRRFLQAIATGFAVLLIASSSAGAACIHPADGSPLEPLGDVTGDSVVNVTDAICSILLSVWTAGGEVGPTPGCTAAPLRADLDCSGTVNVSDAVAIVSLGLDLAPGALPLNEEGCPVACCAGAGTTFVADAGVEAETCESSYTLDASSNAGPSAVGTWTVESGQGTFADPQAADTAVTALGVGANVFRWTVVDGCDSAFDSVTITRNEGPTPSNPGADVAVCGDSAQLAGNAPASGTGTWSIVSSAGSPEFSSTTAADAVVSGLSLGSNVFRWTIAAGECPDSAADVEIWSDEDQVADAGSASTTCGDAVQLVANSAIGDNTGSWSVQGPNGVVVDPTDPASTADLDVGDNTFRWTIDAGGCGLKESTVVHTRLPAPGPLDVGQDQNLPASQTSTTLTAATPTAGVGEWSILEGAGTFSSLSDPQATVTGLSPGLNVFRWTLTLGACTSFADVAVVRPVVCSGSRTISTAADVQNLRVCSEIDGHLTMDGVHEVVDLAWLSNLQLIDGNLSIENNNGLVSLTGLEALVEIDGSVIVNNNALLMDLSGLESLMTVAGSLSVMRNDVIDDLSLPALESVGTDLRVELNAASTWGSTPLDMPALHSVGRDVIIQGNSGLDQCVADAFVGAIAAEGSAAGGTGIVSNTLIDYNDMASCGSTIVSQNPVCNRSFTHIYTNGDIMQLGACSVATGDVYIRDEEITNLEHLSGLTEVTGYFRISGTTDLTSLAGLENLTTVGSYLYVVSNGAALVDVSGLSGVQTVGAQVQISNNAGITSLDGFNDLTSVGGYLYILSNAALDSVTGFASLQHVGGYFRMWRNYGLQTMTGFGSLQTVGEYFYYRENGCAGTLDAFNALESVGEHLLIEYISGMHTLAGFDSLTSIGDYLLINRNSEMVEFSGFNGANPLTVGDYFQLSINVSLETVSGLGALDTIGGELRVYTNRDLLSLEGLTGLTTVEGNIQVYDNDDLPDLTGLSGLTSVGTVATDEFRVFDNEGLSSLMGLDGLTEVFGTLRIDSNPLLLSAAGLSSLLYVGGDLRFEQNDSLATLGVNPNLGAVVDSGIVGNLAIFDNPMLDQCLASDLRDQIVDPAGSGFGITGTVTLLNNQSNALCPNEVPTVDPAACAGSFVVSSAVDLLALASCTTIGGSLTVDGTSILSLEGLQNVTSIGDLTINGNPNLTDISHLSNLTTVVGSLVLTDNVTLPNLGGLENLSAVGGDLRIEQNDQLTSISAISDLETVGSHLRLINNDDLANLSGLSSLRVVGGEFEIKNNDGLLSFQGLGALESVGETLRVQGNKGLVTFQGLTPTFTSLGSLRVNGNWVLEAVDHLTGIVSIPGSVYIDANDLLQSLSGLANLADIGEYLDIRRMDGPFTSLAGLESLETVGDYVYIRQNQNLLSVDGLSGLQTVGGELSIHENASLTNLAGLTSLQSVGDYFRVGENPRLESTAGLSDLATVGSYLQLDQQSAHPDGTPFDVVFPSLDSVGTHLEITDNTNLRHVSLPSLQSVGTYFDLHTNASIHAGDVSAPALNDVPDHIRVSDSSSVASLALTGLATVGTSSADFIRVENLANLASVDIATSLHLTGDFIIFGNPLLPECAAIALSDAIGPYDAGTGTGIEGTITVGNNDTTASCGP